MPVPLGSITISLDPTLELGPLTLSWHGLMTAAGVVLGTAVAVRFGARRGLDRERILNAALVMAVAGIVGARVFFLAVNDPGALLRPGDWLASNGFAIYGAMIGAVLAAAVYLRRHGGALPYLDALAFGFPLALAVGRIGDVINGEHYGPPTTAPWGIRHPHPDADVPSPALAYHDGGLYEVLLGLALLAVVLALRDRLRRPGMLLWTVIGLYSAGRFAMFFYRSDSDGAALGLNEAQLVSLALVAVALVALLASWRAGRALGRLAAAGGRRLLTSLLHPTRGGVDV